MSRLLSVLLGGFVIVNCGQAAEYGRTCGKDTLSQHQICFRYYPTRALEMTTAGKKVEYTVSGENAKSHFAGVEVGDNVTDTYEFKPSVAGKIVIKTRIVEKALYPGDGESEMVTLEGTTPDGVKFLVKFTK